MTEKTDKPVVLIVDDEEDLREAIAFEFGRNGFVTHLAANGEEAFQVIQSTHVDLVLSDVRMPGGDGIGLLKRIREKNIEIPVVIFLTGFADMTLEDAYNAGANVVLSKPFDRKTLLATVRKSLVSRTERWLSQGTQTNPPVVIDLKPGQVLKLGQGGMYVHLESNLPQVSTVVRFSVSFESEPAPFLLEGTGIVRWVRHQDDGDEKKGCGIEFEQLSDACRAKIIELIEKSGTKAFIPKN